MRSILPQDFEGLKRFRRLDWFIVLSVFTLVLLGLSAIYSVDLSRDVGNLVHVEKQLVGIGIGLFLFVIIAFSNFRLLENYAFLAYLGTNLLLILVLFFGDTIRGSTGWFVFPWGSFQPVELMKVGLVMMLATYFSHHPMRPFTLRHIVTSGIYTGFPVFLVMLQPDFGSACVLLGTWVFMLLIAGLPWKFFWTMGVVAVLGFIGSWFWAFEEYQKSRILTFLNPSLDPLGEGYNVTQAIIAVGSGGWWGSGIGFGTQSQLKFVPESQTDFIFAVIGEELGFVGVLLLLVAFGFVFTRLFKHVRFSIDDFSAYILLGSGSVIFLHVLVNIGMNLGLFPVTGIGLPFVSYGGSSLIGMFLLLGMIQSVIMRGVSHSTQYTSIL